MKYKNKIKNKKPIKLILKTIKIMSLIILYTNI
jgi:hypothetical protein